MYGRTNASGKKTEVTATLTISVYNTTQYKVDHVVKDQDNVVLISDTKYTGETVYNNGRASRNAEVQNLNDYISWLEGQNSTLVNNYNTAVTNYNNMKTDRDNWKRTAESRQTTIDNLNSQITTKNKQIEAWKYEARADYDLADAYGQLYADAGGSYGLDYFGSFYDYYMLYN